MPFEKMEVRVSAARNGMPASVSLAVNRWGGRPSCLISLSGDFAKKAKINAGEKFDVLLGSGPQKGLIRFQRNAKGLLAAAGMKHGSIKFNLGHIEKFGTEPEKKEYCNAEVIDSTTIEVVLPRWADEIDE